MQVQVNICGHRTIGAQVGHFFQKVHPNQHSGPVVALLSLGGNVSHFPLIAGLSPAHRHRSPQSKPLCLSWRHLQFHHLPLQVSQLAQFLVGSDRAVIGQLQGQNAAGKFR